MEKLFPQHGGTDAGMEPLYDFSTNANPLGPCQFVYTATRSADLTRYPDPSYTVLRQKLEEHHQVPAGHIVVGAGASELILRMVRHDSGPVIVLGPSFSEYSRCAQIEGRLVIEVKSPEEFLRVQKAHRCLGFVCWPNNPTGTPWPLSFIAEAAQTGRLVVDFAYAPLCLEGELAHAEAAATKAYRLYAPNKTFGLCGVRAAYLIAPHPCPALEALAPSWVVDCSAQAFLAATLQPEALRWLSQCRPQIAVWRRSLAKALTDSGIEVQESPATFLLARVGNATQVTTTLRNHGIRVRDASSFGLPEWIRLACQSPERQQTLLQCLRATLSGSTASDVEPSPTLAQARDYT